MIGDIIQADLEELIRAQRWGDLREALATLHPSDVAELLIDLPRAEEGVIFRILPRDAAAEVFAYLPHQHQAELIDSLSNELTSGMLNQMSPDDRTRLLETMPAEVTRRVLERLSPEELRNARALLGYPEETAGRYMTPEYVALSPEMTARDALVFIRQTGRGKETLAYVYILDRDGRLLDDIKLAAIVLADPDMPVVDIKDTPLVSIEATAKREEVVEVFRKYDRTALPVVDAQGKMLGILTADDVLDAAEAEATEEFQRLGGTEALDAPYLDVGFWSMVRKRGGWLSILFVGEMFTASAMSHFEEDIAKAVVLALFVPLIISSGGNSGSQATSLIIRSLALGELRLRDWIVVFRRELSSGLALGMLLGTLGLMRIIVWQHLHWADYSSHYILVGMTVWLALVGVVTFGTVAGSMLPFLLRRLGFDPATSSAPFVATLVDVTGLCIYFGVALVILRGTLL